MRFRAPFSALPNDDTNIQKRSLAVKPDTSVDINKDSSIFSGVSASKHTPSKPPLAKRFNSRPTPAKFVSDGSFLPYDIVPTTSILPATVDSSVPQAESGDEDTVATAKCSSSGEEELAFDTEESFDSLAVSDDEESLKEVDTEVDGSVSCSLALAETTGVTVDDVVSSTISDGVAQSEAGVPHISMVLDSEGRAHRFCPITKQPAWLFDYWQSTEAKNLFATFEGEKAREGILRHIEALEKVNEHTWSDYTRDKSTTMSEDSMYEIVNTKATYVLSALYIANNELQNCASFTKCCEESIQCMADEEIDSVHDAAVVGRWFADFRKDHKFTLADAGSISTPVWEKSSVYKLFAAKGGETAKEALGRHIDSLQNFNAESWKDYCDKGKIKYLKPTAQGVVTSKAGYVLAALQIAKEEFQHCQSFIQCCRAVILQKDNVEGLQPVDDPAIIYRWFAEFRDHHTFKAPAYSIPYWESHGARVLFDTQEGEDVKQKVTDHIAKLQTFPSDWRNLVVDGHAIDLTGPEKAELCSKIVYVVHAFANALKHMPRLGWATCCSLAVKSIAPMDGFVQVISADAVKVYVQEYLDNGGKFHPIIKANEVQPRL